MADRFLRLRDADLSVRTANVLCGKFGNDTTLGHIFEMTDADLKTAGLGAKGVREIRELIEICRVNGTFEPSARTVAVQADLRDQFAMAALTGLVASLNATERDETLEGARGGKRISVAAYVYADAMMDARRARE